MVLIQAGMEERKESSADAVANGFENPQ